MSDTKLRFFFSQPFIRWTDVLTEGSQNKEFEPTVWKHCTVLCQAVYNPFPLQLPPSSSFIYSSHPAGETEQW